MVIKLIRLWYSSRWITFMAWYAKCRCAIGSLFKRKTLPANRKKDDITEKP